MSEIILPNIPHATVTLNVRNRVVIQMDEGWVFWDRYEYGTDENGNYIEPLPEEISYSRYGVYSPATDFDARIVVVAEREVPENQIFGGVTPPIENAEILGGNTEQEEM